MIPIPKPNLVTKLIIAGVVITLLSGAGYFLYNKHIEAVIAQERAAHNEAQLKAVLKANEEFLAKQKEVMEALDKSLAELNKAKETLDSNTQAILDGLFKKPIEGHDRQSSPILKETIRRLRGL